MYATIARKSAHGLMKIVHESMKIAHEGTFMAAPRRRGLSGRLFPFVLAATVMALGGPRVYGLDPTPAGPSSLSSGAGAHLIVGTVGMNSAALIAALPQEKTPQDGARSGQVKASKKSNSDDVTSSPKLKKPDSKDPKRRVRTRSDDDGIITRKKPRRCTGGPNQGECCCTKQECGGHDTHCRGPRNDRTCVDEGFVCD